MHPPPRFEIITAVRKSVGAGKVNGKRVEENRRLLYPAEHGTAVSGGAVAAPHVPVPLARGKPSDFIPEMLEQKNSIKKS